VGVARRRRLHSVGIRPVWRRAARSLLFRRPADNENERKRVSLSATLPPGQFACNQSRKVRRRGAAARPNSLWQISSKSPADFSYFFLPLSTCRGLSDACGGSLTFTRRERKVPRNLIQTSIIRQIYLLSMGCWVRSIKLMDLFFKRLWNIYKIVSYFSNMLQLGDPQRHQSVRLYNLKYK